MFVARVVADHGTVQTRSDVHTSLDNFAAQDGKFVVNTIKSVLEHDTSTKLDYGSSKNKLATQEGSEESAKFMAEKL